MLSCYPQESTTSESTGEFEVLPDDPAFLVTYPHRPPDTAGPNHRNPRIIVGVQDSNLVINAPPILRLRNCRPMTPASDSFILASYRATNLWAC